MGKSKKTKNIVVTYNSKSITDNDKIQLEVMKRLNDRMRLGQKKYGKDVDIFNDKRGLAKGWSLEAEEEVLDNIVYQAAAVINLRKKYETIVELIKDLGWEAQRMTDDGQYSYNLLCELMDIKESAFKQTTKKG
tara:strand:+ start:794 stop:1195 length:402 start_codon:yes stop_codon:yes gene_type:complete